VALGSHNLCTKILKEDLLLVNPLLVLVVMIKIKMSFVFMNLRL
jgi:hypothetical protein